MLYNSGGNVTEARGCAPFFAFLLCFFATIRCTVSNAPRYTVAMHNATCWIHKKNVPQSTLCEGRRALDSLATLRRDGGALGPHVLLTVGAGKVGYTSI